MTSPSVVRVLSSFAIATLGGGAALAAEECKPVSKETIEAQWADYNTRAGVQRLERPANALFECIAVESSHQIVCLTLAEHPAHPTIVVRTITSRDDGVYIRMEADTAADCAEFKKVMEEFNRLNERLKGGLWEERRERRTA